MIYVKTKNKILVNNKNIKLQTINNNYKILLNLILKYNHL